jgi:midasin (ATPase involved in ribosome maturation)
MLPKPLFALLEHPDLSIRWLAIELLCITLGIADAAKAKYVEDYLGGPENGFTALWEGKVLDYGVMPLFDVERLDDIHKIIEDRQYFSEPRVRQFTPKDLFTNSGEVCGVLFPRFTPMNPNLTSALVMTENTKVNLHEIANAIVAEKPLLLQSIPGAGKSFLIEEIAKLFGRYDGTH